MDDGYEGLTWLAASAALAVGLPSTGDSVLSTGSVCWNGAKFEYMQSNGTRLLMRLTLRDTARGCGF